MMKYAIIVAGGSGSRMNSPIPKQFMLLKGIPLLMHSIEIFHSYDPTIKLIVVLPDEHVVYWQTLCEKYQFRIIHKVVKGGKERFYSVKNALCEIKEDGLVAVHDGVRPLVSNETIRRTFESALQTGAAIPGLPVVDSIRMLEDGRNKPVDRSAFCLIQTPQVFKTQLLIAAYEQEYQPLFTDDAAVVENLGYRISLVEGNKENIKVTNPQDIVIAEALMDSTLDS
jgi:2-C-methyl-D-erythritol 4-phosphate cytidylyltransferase